MRAGLECGSSCAVQYVTYHATYSTRHGLPEVCESCLHGEHAIRLKEGRQSDESELLAMEEQTPVKEDEYNDMEDYLIFVTDTQATLLKGSEGQGLHQEVRQTTGADVQLFPRLPSARDTNTVIVRGSRLQIQEAVRLIYQKTEAQTFWLKWVEAAFPDLDSRAYFLPPVYFNRVPMTRQSVAGQDVRILPPEPGKTGNALVMIGLSAITGTKVQESDVRDDTAMQRVVVCLQKMFEHKKKALVGISQLGFGQYLGESCFAAAAAQLPKATNLPSALSRGCKQGDFDVLLIHRHHGFVVFEVKAFGDNLQKLSMSQQDIDKCIRKKLRQAACQLNKAEAMLSHLVSGIAPGLRITKVIALPHLFARQVQKAISQDSQLTQVLRECLKTKKSANIADLCLCCDQLSDPKTPLEVSKKVLKKLKSWWHRRVTDYGHDSHMTRAVYHILIARFCGPATTVTVPCTCPPRVCIKTLGQAVSHTGECYTAVITLFPEQVHLLHTAPPRLFVTGPPGTGKTVVLLLMAIEWLRYGHHVYILSTSDQSHAVCSMLHHVMLKTWKEEQAASASSGQLHLLTFKFSSTSDVEKVLNDLSQAARVRPLYVIADEVYKGESFVTFCVDLLTRVPDLHLWAASCFYRDPPAGWLVESLTRPLRSPPVVVREVQKDVNISADFLRTVHPYSERGVPDHTDGPPVIRLYHRGQGHPCDTSENCVTCGREIANVLSRLGVGVAENTTTSTTVTCSSSGTTPPCLQWRDVLVLYCVGVSDDSGIVTGLKEAGIPVRVMKDDDVEDVATARSDVVWVTDGDRVRGLERKVVVCLQPHNPLVTMSRCMSQLVIVFPDR